MKKHFLSYAILSIVLFLVSCGKNTDYAKIVPAEVDQVVTFDFEKIIAQSGLSNANLTESQLQIKESLKENLSAEEKELFEKIFSDPREIGIDWSRKSYLFRPVQSNLVGFVCAVSDEDKIKTFFETFGSGKTQKVQFTDDVNFSWANTQSTLIALNNESCLVLVSSHFADTEDLKEKATKWMNQTNDASFTATRYHEMLLDTKGEVALFSTINNQLEDYSMFWRLFLSEDMDLSSTKYFVGVSFNDGQIEAKGNVLYEDEELREWMKDNSKAVQKLKGNSLSFFPNSTPLWFGMGIEGDKLFEQLSKHPVVGKELESSSLPIDFESILESLDGDFTFAYPHGLFVEVKNDEILKLCVSTLGTMGSLFGLDISQIAENQYKINDKRHVVSRYLQKDAEIQMGLKDDSFYFFTSGDALKKLTTKQSLASAPWADKVEGQIIFFAFDFQEGQKLINMYTKIDENAVRLINHFDYITYSQKNNENMEVVLSFTDKERNSLEQLLELAVTFSK